MTGLEQTFYIMAIIFMGLTFVSIIGILAAVLVIRKKITKIHDTIESKIDAFTSIAGHGGDLSSITSKVVLDQAKKAFKKAVQ